MKQSIPTPPKSWYACFEASVLLEESQENLIESKLRIIRGLHLNKVQRHYYHNYLLLLSKKCNIMMSHLGIHDVEIMTVMYERLSFDKSLERLNM